MKFSPILLLCLPLAALAKGPDDYANGMRLQAADGQPLQELPIPDEVYAGVLRADLGDLRVFNAEGTAVPHALCAPAQPQGQRQEQTLPSFPLQRRAESEGGVRVDVRTADADVQVSGALTPGPPPVETQAWVIDARGMQEPLRALRLDWRTSDGVSEAQVRIDASNDLDQWQTVVARTTLLRSDAPQATLERLRLSLPPAKYQYLRIERVGAGAALVITGVIGESELPAEPLQPMRVAALPQPETEPRVTIYDAGRQAPVDRAWVPLPAQNMSLQLTLSSRAIAPTDKDKVWQQRWSGEVNSVSVDGVEPPPVSFEQTRDRWWRLQVTGGAETLGEARPLLELGYVPQRLRFLAQGAGPYTLAYGSARAPVMPAPACDSLLAGRDEAQRQQMTGIAVPLSGAVELGGPAMLTPLPEATPLRVILLWATLGIGALALLGMALSLLKRLREPPAGE